MSGFSADWLALREPVDHRSRSPELADVLARRFAGSGRLRVVDLGAGTGSNLRALAPRLAPLQDWHLVDDDPALVAVAIERLTAWADTADTIDGALTLTKAGVRIRVTFRACDLAREIEAAIPAACDLVTASALFDLTSEAWMARLVDAVAARGATLFAALTYDGRDAFAPAHPLDAAVVAAFAGHMRRDKGFGVAAGPQAHAVLTAATRAAGYEIAERDSAWVLGPGDADLGRALHTGMAAAVAETGAVPFAALDAWTAFRRDVAARAGTRIVSGHTDLLAHPPIRAASGASPRP
jgi:hypothetical protein